VNFLNKLFKKYNENLKLSLQVGLSHWKENKKEIDLKNKVKVFFAPKWVKKRSEDLGIELYNRQVVAWKNLLKSNEDWTLIDLKFGNQSILNTFDHLFSGNFDPKIGFVLSFDLPLKSKL
jgi:tRNA(His) 5'-end guanylyltransferase